jgi:transposase
MNWTLFRKWFTEQLLPNIPQNSLIIMNNAPYHKVLTAEAFPKSSHSISKLQEWLTHNEIPWRKDMLKIELYDLCSRFAPKPEFMLDKLASEQGHTILRTPPYHPELQPIEVCWAVVKGHVAAHNDFKGELVIGDTHPFLPGSRPGVYREIQLSLL